MRIPLLVLCCLFFLGVSQAQDTSRRATTRALDNRIENSLFGEAHTGFALYDLEAQRPVYGYNANRYFVPASNTKLLTFLVANRLLEAAAPAVVYQAFEDRIELWGTGYPLLLHPAFVGYDTLLPWLATRDLPLVLNFPNGDIPPRYGAGWSWDDFNYGYVFERSLLPVYGNRLYLEYREAGDTGREALFGSPAEVVDNLVMDAAQERTISRVEGSNRFTVNANFYRPYNFPLERALSVDSATTVRYLSSALPGSSIRSGDRPRPPLDALRTISTPLPDTLYRKLLQDSDNYLAEQLILLAATSRYGRPDEEAFFEWATDTLFQEMGLGEISFRDGSGLSRYNLVKPEQLVQVIAALDREVGRERLRSLLPTGGINGTLKQRFDNQPEPYVWAKTGSLSGVICISGLLRTRSGRWLAFSFMHNNVMGSSREYYATMEDILGWVYENLR
ncbi:D-alanyl-D-alanine carboxypeptidase/D-alanyl-D-alanine-endopeptidase (penicillin-binding protein 4) [Neolewinella xylanilytica]|uniref:D-alanyl-D-alanine carboxypeptidase/D-alanyl-D-alanine-endopeptidase (Penicillin-binding protein 4) n=1 Tax=Neolewinella xylanilytica TaxID=1514080 RepID=A0A2S6I6T4_9BACT|nr:D-alanyl-D-alanine carboxypeptidase [Neolewinella xylanilytica]PPK87197.1 D-alanyl-D-alanine carboxypeptidase/D-alanyl-D-alanine-endopeptidase (penicillin-binding protein 4) [Neolewinella xylanilytica]